MSALLSKILALIGAVPRKLLYALITAGLEGLRAAVHAAHPDWTLPTTDQVLAMGAGLIACHTLTDVVHLIADAIAAWRQTKPEA